MGNVRKEKFMRQYLAEGDAAWNMNEPFTAVTFSYWFNQRYGNYSTSPSGMRVYFLRMEKDGLVNIDRDDSGKILTYERVKKDDNCGRDFNKVQKQRKEETGRKNREERPQGQRQAACN